MRHAIVCALFCTAAATTAAGAAAASPFDGTWKSDLSRIKQSTKPEIYRLAGGRYTCETCKPAFTVAADGAAHPVTGHAYYDAVAVKVTGPSSATITATRGGKPVFVRMDSVSADGRTLTTAGKGWNPATGAESTSTTTASRSGAATPGAHPLTGHWLDGAVTQASENATSQTMKVAGDTLTLTTPTGEGYVARFGGPAVLQKNDVGKTMIRVEKLAADHILETDSRDGKPIRTFDMKVAPGGREMVMTVTDKRDGATTTIPMVKQ